MSRKQQILEVWQIAQQYKTLNVKTLNTITYGRLVSMIHPINYYLLLITVMSFSTLVTIILI